MMPTESGMIGFSARVAELGGTVIEPTWLGSNKRHRVVCKAGHDCTPRPDSVLRGQGLCVTCAGKDPKVSEALFKARVSALGGVVTEPEWRGVGTPHRVICANGHECTPTPDSVRRGRGLCRTCSGNDPKNAESQFRARIAELGGIVIEPAWLGNHHPHRVICVAGHECSPRPNGLRHGQGPCRTCAGNDPTIAEDAFRSRVTELGGIVVEPSWLGVGSPHRVICPAGHTCSPSPTNVARGQGLCRACVTKAWTVFYVVEDNVHSRVKFGITAGDAHRRIRDHGRAGYRMVVRLLTNLADGVAYEMERHVLSTLRLADEQPIHGREYFGSHVLATVLDIVDHYPVKGKP